MGLAMERSPSLHRHSAGGLARLLGTCCGSGGEPHLHLTQRPPSSPPPRRSKVHGQHPSKPSSAPSVWHHPTAQPRDRRNPRPCGKNVPCSSCCCISASSVSEKAEKESITVRPAPCVSRAKSGWWGGAHQNRNVPDTSSLRGSGLGRGWGGALAEKPHLPGCVPTLGLPCRTPSSLRSC